ncbi:MAG: alpha/beta hydrolase [Gemmatimonadaceae bacterium]
MAKRPLTGGLRPASIMAPGGRRAGPRPHPPRATDIDADILRIPAGAGSLHVERYGQGGEPIVLLHGFGTSSFLWRAVGPTIAQHGHTALAVDLLGYGESDRPFDADYSLRAQADYLDRALSAMRVERATIAGVDIGGGVGQILAVRRPARVAKLALINSVGFDEWPADDVKGVRRGTARFALRVSRGMLGAAPLLTPVLEGSVFDPQYMPPRLVARYLAPYVGRDGVSHLLALARALKADDLDELDLSAIRAQTLIVWGEGDRWLDLALADRLQAAIPGSQLVRIPAVGRLVPEELPEALAGLLIEFVETPERTPEEVV